MSGYFSAYLLAGSPIVANGIGMFVIRSPVNKVLKVHRIWAVVEDETPPMVRTIRVSLWNTSGYSSGGIISYAKPLQGDPAPSASIIAELVSGSNDYDPIVTEVMAGPGTKDLRLPRPLILGVTSRSEVIVSFRPDQGCTAGVGVVAEISGG